MTPAPTPTPAEPTHITLDADPEPFGSYFEPAGDITLDIPPQAFGLGVDSKGVIYQFERGEG